jgi:hypothetical protein
MGFIKHHAIIVTCWRTKDIKEARGKAVEIFNKFCTQERGPAGCIVVGEITEALINVQKTFLIAPDGSFEGREESDQADRARRNFLNWLDSTPENHCEFAEVTFGGSDIKRNVLRTNLEEIEE